MLRTTKLMCALSVLLLISIGYLYMCDYTINVTESYPLGLYKLSPVSSTKKAKGKLVLVCPDPRNPVIKLATEEKILPLGSRCKNTELAPLLKRLVGVPGDHIAITENGVIINGKIQQNSLLDFPYFERLIQPGDDFILEQDEYWVMSEYNPSSFDSRYFGSIRENQIQAISKPILTR